MSPSPSLIPPPPPPSPPPISILLYSTITGVLAKPTPFPSTTFYIQLNPTRMNILITVVQMLVTIDVVLFSTPVHYNSSSSSSPLLPLYTTVVVVLYYPLYTTVEEVVVVLYHPCILQ